MQNPSGTSRNPCISDNQINRHGIINLTEPCAHTGRICNIKARGIHNSTSPAAMQRDNIETLGIAAAQ